MKNGLKLLREKNNVSSLLEQEEGLIKTLSDQYLDSLL